MILDEYNALPVVNVRNVSYAQTILAGAVGGVVGVTASVVAFNFAFPAAKKSRVWLSEQKAKAENAPKK